MRALTRHSPHRRAVLAGRAREMRHAGTASEELLFSALRGRQLGVLFRRRVPVLGRYIADLLAPEVRLIAEVDGGWHGRRRAADERRDRALERAGYRVLRIPAEMVLRELAVAVDQIRKALAEVLL